MHTFELDRDCDSQQLWYVLMQWVVMDVRLDVKCLSYVYSCPLFVWKVGDMMHVFVFVVVVVVVVVFSSKKISRSSHCI